MHAPNQILVLYFDPNHAPTRQKVHDCLVKLSPGSANRMESLLENGRVVLKRNADPEKDGRIMALLAQTGGVCRFENAAPAKEKSETPPLSDGEMICPKCRLLQTKAAECIHCGLIIEKFKPPSRPPKPRDPAPHPPLKPAAEPPASGTGLLEKMDERCNPTVQKIWQWLKGNPLSGEMVQQWSQRLADAVFRCIVVFLVSLALEIGLLYLSRMVWFVYTSTAVGQVYLEKFTNEESGIPHLMHSNMALAGLQACLAVLVICILAGIVAQWLHLVRFLYLPFGFLGHLLLWVLPLTGGSAWYLYQNDVMNQMNVACALTFLPSLILLPCCIHLVRTAVPEMGAVIRAGKSATGGLDHPIHQLKRKIETWWQEMSGS